METCCKYNMYMLHGHTLKSATSDYDQRHVIAFRPISAAARSWSYDKSTWRIPLSLAEDWATVPDNMFLSWSLDVWFLRDACRLTDAQKDKHAHRNISHPYWRQSKYYRVWIAWKSINKSSQHIHKQNQYHWLLSASISAFVRRRRLCTGIFCASF